MQTCLLLTYGSLSTSEQQILRNKLRVIIWTDELHKNKSPADIGVYDVLVIDVQSSFFGSNKGLEYIQKHKSSLAVDKYLVVYLFRKSANQPKVLNTLYDACIKKLPSEVSNISDLKYYCPIKPKKLAADIKISPAEEDVKSVGEEAKAVSQKGITITYRNSKSNSSSSASPTLYKNGSTVVITPPNSGVKATTNQTADSLGPIVITNDAANHEIILQYKDVLTGLPAAPVIYKYLDNDHQTRDQAFRSAVARKTLLENARANLGITH